MLRYHSFLGIGVICIVLGGWCAAEESDVDRTGPIKWTDFEQIRGQLDLKLQPWTRISWQATITDARLAAAREKKPIFLMVNTGACVGFV